MFVDFGTAIEFTDGALEYFHVFTSARLLDQDLNSTHRIIDAGKHAMCICHNENVHIFIYVSHFMKFQSHASNRNTRSSRIFGCVSGDLIFSIASGDALKKKRRPAVPPTKPLV